MGVVNRPIRHLPSHLHSPKLKEIPKVLPQVTSFQFTPLSPQVFTMIVKEVKLMALTREIRLYQYLDDWLIVSGRLSDNGRPNQSLDWKINQEKSELPTQVFSFVGYEFHLDSALKKPSQEKWLKFQDSSQNMFLTTRCLMSLIGLLAAMEKMVPEGRLHMRPF